MTVNQSMCLALLKNDECMFDVIIEQFTQLKYGLALGYKTSTGLPKLWLLN